MADQNDQSGPSPVEGAPGAESFVRLYTSHELRLRAFALSLVPNWADAEEIVQEASIVLWRKFGEFKPGTNFFAWAAKVINFTARNFQKRHSRDKLKFSDEFYDAVMEDFHGMSEELAVRQQALGNCIAKLKPEQREVLRLRYVEGRDVEAVAKAVSRSAVAIYHALSKIRKQLLDCVTRTVRPEGAL